MLRKWLIFLIAFWCLHVNAQSGDQSLLDTRISITFGNVSLATALRQLNRQANIRFSYNTNIIPRTDKILSVYNRETLKQILEDLLTDTELFYLEVNGNIVIRRKSYGKNKLVGRVVDQDNGDPLPFTNVFIDNTTIGVATDTKGNFVLENVPEIAFSLVISYVGYETKIIEFNKEQQGSVENLEIPLKENPTELDAVSVSPEATRRYRKARKQFFKRFKSDFLGRSENARKCRIENPNVLRFYALDSENNYNYRVVADSRLFIENLALGYRIAYDLDEFIFKDGVPTYVGTAEFETIEARSRKQNRQWINARRISYNGSMMHFLNALISDEVEEQGFEVNVIQFDSVTSEYNTVLPKPPLSEIISVQRTEQSLTYQLLPNTDIEVAYTREYEDTDYVKRFREKTKSGNFKYTDRKVIETISLSDGQTLSTFRPAGQNIPLSSLELYQKSVILFNNQQPLVAFPGYFNNARDIQYLGWWTWEALSERLPVDYRPRK